MMKADLCPRSRTACLLQLSRRKLPSLEGQAEACQCWKIVQFSSKRCKNSCMQMTSGAWTLWSAGKNTGALQAHWIASCLPKSYEADLDLFLSIIAPEAPGDCRLGGRGGVGDAGKVGGESKAWLEDFSCFSGRHSRDTRRDFLRAFLGVGNEGNARILGATVCGLLCE